MYIYMVIAVYVSQYNVYMYQGDTPELGPYIKTTGGPVVIQPNAFSL